MQPPHRIGVLLAATLSVAACGSKGDGGPSLPACPATDAFLTVPPLAASDYVAIVPLGNLNPSGHVFPTDHVYWYLVPAGGGLTEVAPVVSPGPLVVVRVGSSEHLSAIPPFTDYDLTLAACDGLTFRFGHLASIDPGVEALLGGAADCRTYSTGGQSYRSCTRTARIEVAAGTPLGTAGGNPGQLAMDLWAVDLRKPPLPFANPASWIGDTLHARCPLDYFEAGAGAALASRLGDYSGTAQRTAPPVCGEVEQDEPGTAQGAWRRVGAPDLPEDPHVALVHDNVDPSRPVFSIGTSFPGFGPGVFGFVPQGSGRVDRDFRDVGPDGAAWCWNVGGRRLVAVLDSATALRLEPQSGACDAGPWSLGAGAVSFRR